MIVTNRIRHKDLIRLGYYFPEREDERIFLNAVNEELYDRINRSLKHQCDSVIQVEHDEIENSTAENPAHNKIVAEIRAELIDELKRMRREVLMRDSK